LGKLGVDKGATKGATTVLPATVASHHHGDNHEYIINDNLGIMLVAAFGWASI
jgi:hypothetical protein